MPSMVLTSSPVKASLLKRKANKETKQKRNGLTEKEKRKLRKKRPAEKREKLKEAARRNKNN